jgi:cytochrome c oxidase cbb3-type subunit 2
MLLTFWLGNHSVANTVRFGLLAAILIVSAVGAGSAQAGPFAAGTSEGERAYRKYCARCHGDKGLGDGIDSKRFYPRPRDLELAIYKFQSAVNGTPPMDEDLFSIITHGLSGSGMPDWEFLEEDVRRQLVTYLKELSTYFKEVEPEPVNLLPDPGPKAADLARGRAVFERLDCKACHGPNGRANGPSAAKLKGEREMPIRPRNLTQGWNYRGGSDPKSVARRVMTGIEGCGMPSFSKSVSPEELWHLAYYVVSLQQPASWKLIVRATRIEGDLPRLHDDSRWAQAEQTTLRLRNVVDSTGAQIHPPTVIGLSFRILFNREVFALKLSWDDPSEDRAQEDPKRQPTGAEHNIAGPVVDAQAQTRTDGLAVVLKPPDSGGDVVSLQVWPYVGAPRLDICHWSARSSRAFETIAEDFSYSLSEKDQPVKLASWAAYDDGFWSLVIHRPLGVVLDKGALITSGQVFSVAFVVWDGSNEGQRALTPWTDVHLGVLRAKAEQ